MNIIGIGNGGIGSFLWEYIDSLIEKKQIEDYNFTCYDDDRVELKNILYQNFITQDIGKFKSKALERRFLNIKFEVKRLEYQDLNCDLIIICADNNKIRREVYQNYLNHKIPFIDARANGRAIGIFSSDTPNYLQTISEDNESSSCQNPFQLAKKEIELGNIIIATITAQAILNYYRYNKLPIDNQLYI